jgi:hypothetical protein
MLKNTLYLFTFHNSVKTLHNQHNCQCKCKWLCDFFPVVSSRLVTYRLVSQLAANNLSDRVNTT